jgi:hypothetical protein
MTDRGVKRIGVALGRKRRLSGIGGCAHDLAFDLLAALIPATRDNNKYERKKTKGGWITQKLKEEHGQRDLFGVRGYTSECQPTNRRRSCCLLFGMATQSQSAHSPIYPRGRGGSARPRSRGGLGKHLRARGRGHRGGRPAVFQERLLLEDEQPDELNEEEVAELNAHFAKRTLSTNADRYEEPEPEIGSDGTVVSPTVLSLILPCQQDNPWWILRSI